ncbi:MAG: NAD(P)H-dependent glycerol-3-phosphate dehydrogenase, partial [Williamsia herbipolensis]|nr:NAD(P)H-dependent glycerol-3-phosphate dehydrogenase [Williamsia herbipolensis]
MARAAVLGSGSWGTAMAAVLTDAGTSTTLWARRPELARTITDDHANPDYLPGIDLPPALRAVSDVDEALDGADLVVCAVPSQSLRANLARWRGTFPSDAAVLSLAKGIESDTLLRMTEVIADVSGTPDDRVAVLSGPNLAREVALRQPAATVVACRDESVARSIQNACTTGYFRPYTNTDVVGCEIGGAVKNVIALA